MADAIGGKESSMPPHEPGLRSRAPEFRDGHFVSDENPGRPDLLSFSREVFDARLELVQEDIAAQGFAGALIFNPENIFWLTGYHTIGYFAFHAAFVPRQGLPVVISWIANKDLALAHPTIGGFVEILDDDDPVEILSQFLAEVHQTDLPIGFESNSRFLSVCEFECLQELSDRVFMPWNSVIGRQRTIKSAEEIDRIRRACRAAEAGMDAAIREAAPGKTENDIAAAMFQSSIRAGSEYLGHPPLVVVGRTTALCFATWRRREIRQGDVLLLESAGCVDRYHGILSRPVIVGKPKDQHKRSAEALTRGLNAAIDAIRPGVKAGDVDQACRSAIEASGLGAYFKQEVGYGIGIGFPPNWSESSFLSIRPNNEMELCENMTFHLIPTIFTEDFGMCMSESVRVAEDGCEVFTRYREGLIEI